MCINALCHLLLPLRRLVAAGAARTGVAAQRAPRRSALPPGPLYWGSQEGAAMAVADGGPAAALAAAAAPEDREGAGLRSMSQRSTSLH